MKGKSRMRARMDIMRSRAADVRRKARQHYDKRQYDKPASEES